MSRQINLYDPALLRRREWITAGNVLAGVILVCGILFAWGGWLSFRGARLETQVADLERELKAAREESVTLGTQLANLKPDPELERNLAAVKDLLGLRKEMLAELSKGSPQANAPYGDYLRGLARQALGGLWLTGFAVEAGDRRMEIRGRTLDPALVPEYIRRLNAEPAFRGHRFAALSVNLPAPARTQSDPGVRPAPALQPYHEFALVPDTGVRPDGGVR